MEEGPESNGIPQARGWAHGKSRTPGVKRVAMTAQQKVELLRYFESFPSGDRPTQPELAAWAKQEFQLNNPPSVPAISTILRDKVKILSEPFPCCEYTLLFGHAKKPIAVLLHNIGLFIR